MTDAKRGFSNWGASESYIKLASEDADSAVEAAKEKKGSLASSGAGVKEQALEKNIHVYFQNLQTLSLEAAYPYFLEAVCLQSQAEYGAILIEREDALYIRNLWEKGRERIRQTQEIDFEAFDALPKTIIRFVSRTYENVELNHQTERGYFSGDAYLMDGINRSILCLPLKYKGIFAGVLYLERRDEKRFANEIIHFTQNLAFDLIAKQVIEKEVATAKQKPVEAWAMETLTKREVDVLKQMSEGLSNREIAEVLNISTSTVKTHTLNIYGKLEVNTRLQAVTKSMEVGLI